MKTVKKNYRFLEPGHPCNGMMMAMLCMVELDEEEDAIHHVTTGACESQDDCVQKMWSTLVDNIRVRDIDHFCGEVLDRADVDPIQEFLDNFMDEDYSSVTKAQLKAIELTEAELRLVVKEMYPPRYFLTKLEFVQL